MSEASLTTEVWGMHDGSDTLEFFMSLMTVPLTSMMAVMLITYILTVMSVCQR